MTTLTINGRSVTFDAPEDTPLLWVLRDVLGMTGTKFGCGIAQCGACTVHIDGNPVRSCLLPVGSIGTKAVTTIEGVGASEAGAKVQKAWLDLEVIQCGYCQSGQIMSAAALLAATANPDDSDIDAAMAGNMAGGSLGPSHDALLRSTLRSGVLDRSANAHIGPTAADISCHRGIDVGVIRIGRCLQQCRRRHDLAGLAIAALDHFEIEPRLLHLGADRRVADAFDGGDRPVADRSDGQHAGTHGLAADMDRAGAALRDAATEFRASQPKNIAEYPEQGHIVGNIDGFLRTIDR